MTNKKKNTKITKKTAIGLLVLGQIMTTGALAAPQEAISAFKDVKEIRQDIGHFKGEIKLFIEKDGKKTRVDQNMKDGLRVVEGRTCVGVRDLVNAIEGAEVEWDQANKIVDIRYGGNEISYPLGKPVMWNGDKMVTIDVPAQVDPSISRTFLPIRNIAETLGFKVDWNQKTKEVTLKPGAGTGQTTTTQQPKANTNAGSGLIAASGTKLPDPSTIFKGKVGLDSEYIKIKVDPRDIENNNGVLTFYKGTIYEMQALAEFKTVKSSPANPNFKIFGENKDDSRIGTAIVGVNYPGIEKYVERRNGHTSIGIMGSIMPDLLGEDVMASRRLTNPQEITKMIESIIKAEDGGYKWLLENYKMNPNKVEVYDMTGLVDVSLGLTLMSNIDNGEGVFYNSLFESMNEYVIDANGRVYSCKNIPLGTAVDKIIAKDFYDTYYVVDVPNFTFKRPNIGTKYHMDIRKGEYGNGSNVSNLNIFSENYVFSLLK